MLVRIVFLQLRWFGFLSVPHFDSHVVLIAGTAGDDAVTEEGNACNEKAEENPEIGWFIMSWIMAAPSWLCPTRRIYTGGIFGLRKCAGPIGDRSGDI